jgi:hypothetical protein
VVWTVDESLPTTHPLSVWLRDWLAAAEAATDPYTRNDFTERERPADVAARLAMMLMDAKSDLALAKRMVDRLGWNPTGARLRPSKQVQGQHGDFGEVLTVGLLREFWGRSVPVVKLRFQTDPEQSLHGTDVVGFVFVPGATPSAIDTLEFVECKVSVGVDNRPGAKAHKQLKDDREGGFADTLDFLHQQLGRMGSELLGTFEDYLADRRDGPLGSYRICLVYDRDAWRETVLEALPDELVLPLSVDVVMIGGLRELIAASWASIGPSLLAGLEEVPGA